MTTRIIHISELSNDMRKTAHALADGGERAMRRAARRGIGIVQAQINETLPYVPVDTGTYRRAWTVEDIEGGADLFNPVAYAPIIEWGSEPHDVPLSVLMEWARRKLRGSAPRGGGSGGGGIKAPRRRRANLKRSLKRVAKGTKSAIKRASKGTARSFKAASRSVKRVLAGKPLRPVKRKPTARSMALAAARAQAKAAKTQARVAARQIRATNKAQARAAALSLHEEQVRALAWRAQQSIAAKGTEPREVMTNSVPMFVRAVEYELDRALTEAVLRS